MDELISVIIPVYNVQQYLEKCIESVVNQTYKNLEIILIDDGSTDMSGKICDEFAEKDGRIKVIHSKNGGVSAARNIGLDIATGEYIGFVDSDDWIESQMYEKLLKNIKSNNADISICDVFIEQNGTKIHTVLDKYKQNFTRKEILEILFDNVGFNWLWNKLIKRKLFENYDFENKIRLHTDIYMGEDILCVCECICRSEIISYVSEPLYHYLQRSGSACKNKFNLKKTTNINAYEKITKIYEKNAPIFENIAKVAYIEANIHVINWMFLDKCYEKDIVEEIRKNIKKCCTFGIYSNLKMNHKIEIILIAISPKLLYKCIGFIKLLKNLFK